MTHFNKQPNGLIPVNKQKQLKNRSFRHFWTGLVHSLRWSQLRQKLSFQRLLSFGKRQWFPVTVIVLLVFIFLQRFSPFGGNALHNQTITADFSKNFTPEKPDAYSLPEELPATGNRDTRNESANQRAKQYIQRFAKVAQDEQKKYNIPASVIIALSLLCSDVGTSDLSQQYNNHFAITCDKNMFKTDVQMITKDGDCYAKYPTAWASFRAHSLMVTSGIYKELPKIAANDVTAWASGLERIGYPHPQYSAEVLLSLIETYNLKKFD